MTRTARISLLLALTVALLATVAVVAPVRDAFGAPAGGGPLGALAAGHASPASVASAEARARFVAAVEKAPSALRSVIPPTGRVRSAVTCAAAPSAGAAAPLTCRLRI